MSQNQVGELVANLDSVSLVGVVSHLYNLLQQVLWRGIEVGILVPRWFSLSFKQL